MKAVILYQPDGEFDSSVHQYTEDFKRQTGKDIELVDKDLINGAELARLYDIMQFPAIIAFEDDGSFMQAWTEREKWPVAAELSFYVQ